MGYLKNKYTKEYFLKVDSEGKPTQFGADGAELFLSGEKSIRDAEYNILKRVNFNGKNVLEFGFGRGEAIRYAKENGAHIVHGVDFSQNAYEIARSYLKQNDIDANLYCMDAIDYIENIICNEFDIVLMLDFVEHVPRKELSIIIAKLSEHLNDHAVIVINTPIFCVDNDVIEEGLKREAADTSDLFEETRGMHCNRYTEESLKYYMSNLNYYAISNHYFISKTAYNENNSIINWSNFCEIGFPFVNKMFEAEVFEYAYIPEVHKDRVNLMYFPIWHTIQDGLLKGRQVYIDTRDNFWQKDIVEGKIDYFYWKVINAFDLAGKTVFDIGAHIGYHSMMFAELVGEKGVVYAFEPNPYNFERMQKNLDRNQDLRRRIILNNIAISNSDSYIEFNFSKEIDNGLSSGSFIKGSSTPYSDEVYEKIGYEKILVKTITLNSIVKYLKISDKDPCLIKIDVEGAESIILNSSTEFIKKYKPIFLIELHTIENVLKVFKFFAENNYLIEVLHFENENYLFIYAKYQPVLSLEEFLEYIRKITKYSLNALNQLQTDHAQLQTHHAQLQTHHTQLQTDHAQLQTDHAQLQTDHAQLQTDHAHLQTDHAHLQTDNNKLQADYTQLKEKHTQIQERHTGLINNRIIRVLNKVRRLIGKENWK